MALLKPEPGKVLVDGTLGGCGHTTLMLERGARVIGVDRDSDAIENSRKTLERFGERFCPQRGNFLEIPSMLDRLGIELVDGVLLDLGVSSHQLDVPERGFSYMQDGPLDMRMDEGQAFTAYHLVNTYSQKELYRVISEYGEERFANSIARRICEQRAQKPIESTRELSDIVKSAIPARFRQDGPHPAKRTFQAIRIEVNDELAPLSAGVEDITKRIRPGGRIAVITFHSLEDRIIKNIFRTMANPCTCPPKSPVCVCHRKPLVQVVTRKPILPAQAEVEYNPRSRSAKLRAAERIETF